MIPLYFSATSSPTSWKLVGLLVPKSYIPDGLSLLRTISTTSSTHTKSLKNLSDPSNNLSAPVS